MYGEHLIGTCMFGHVVLQLGLPFAFVSTLRTQILLLWLVNSHVNLYKKTKAWQNRAYACNMTSHIPPMLIIIMYFKKHNLKGVNYGLK